MKALLIHLGIVPPRTHDLTELDRLLAPVCAGCSPLTLSPRSGRQNLAHGVSRGFEVAPSSPFPPLAPARERGEQRGCGPSNPGLAPWANLFRPYGAVKSQPFPDPCLRNWELRSGATEFA
jgi:hypothetical protein